MKKKIEINYSEGEGEEMLEVQGQVVLKRLDFDGKNSLDEEATEIKVFGDMPQVKVSSKKMKELAILKSVVETDLKKITYSLDKSKQLVPNATPLNLDITGIRSLPVEVGEQLFVEFSNLNTLSDKKKER